MLGNILKGLFGTSEKASRPAVEPVLYDGYEIFAEPRSAGGQWQVAGRIEKDVEGDRKSHVFIRADTMPSADEARAHMIRKAKVLIDQQGSSIF